jgi:hypothetical protein
MRGRRLSRILNGVNCADPQEPTMFRKLILTAAAAAALAAPSAANAATQLNSVAIATGASSNLSVLDVAGASTALGAKVIQYPATGGSNQRWNTVVLPDGNMQIINQHSGMCLSTNGLSGSQLYQWTCTLGARQEWSGELYQARFGFGGYTTHLQNPSSGLYADVEGASGLAGTRIIGWSARGGYNQTFNYWQL